MVHARKRQQHPFDKSRELQRKLYLAAKKNRTRRFHALYDRIYRPDVLWRAWIEVKANRGSHGVDGVTLETVESQGERQYLQKLQRCLKEGKYRPQPVRRVYIPKPDGSQRPLGIPTVRDRIVQQACRIVVEPLFEANFQTCSYGFRPKRSAVQAVADVKEALVTGWDVVDADIRGFFDHLDHALLLRLLKKRISDRHVLKLMRQWLESGVLESGDWQATVQGSPQGGVISPLLANIYLHVLDMYWQQQYFHLGKLVRYADDFVIVCKKRHLAGQAIKAVKDVLNRLKLELHPEKTRVVDLNKDGFDFLGFHFHKFKSRRSGKIVPYIWPTPKAMKSIRRKIHDLTDVRWLRCSPEAVVKQLAPVVRGWANYYRRGNATRYLQSLDNYVYKRLWHFYWKRHNRCSIKVKDKFLRWVRTVDVESFYVKGYCGRVV